MSTETHQSTNRLAQESSPYLLQHAHNPVDWFPWGQEALEKARKEGKPIFLSIGYSACHWCHVMERESFSSPAIAKVLNENYVAIKVDREERPDLDEIYMAATLSITGQGGWPMNVFLTPDLKPFFAGTFFPAEDGPGRPGFLTLVSQLSEVWKNSKDDLVEQADRITARLKRQFKGDGKVLGLEPELLDQSISDLAQRFDAENGGFGKAPKFPAPSNLQLLLRYHARSGDPRVGEMAARTLDGMANGGIFDHLGGGFARYAVDERWVVPHFEKMLYDNAQMANLYIEGYQATQSQLYKKVARQTLDYLLRDLASPEGGFHSSRDAESEGEEGKYYCWTVEEILAALGEGPGRNFCAFYGVNSQGNWEGKNVLHVSRPLNQVAAQLGLDADDYEKELETSRAKLLEARAQRVAPGLDDKIVTSWNGMAIQALAEGYRVFGEARYLEAARKTAAFVKANLTKGEGRLLRSWRAGKAHLNAYLEDYAFLAEGLLSLYEACGEFEYFAWAQQLTESMQKHFAHPDGGFYDTSDDHEALLVRHRNSSDAAVPSAQAVAALVLARLAYHLDRQDLREQALGTLLSLGKELRAFPAGFCRHLLVLDYCLAGPLEVCWSLPADTGRQPIMDALGRLFVPNRAIAWLRAGESHPELKLTEGKPAEASATGHFCQSGTCAAPVTQAEDVVKAIATLKEHVRFELHPRLPGAATPEATARLAAEKPKAYKKLGKTNLMVSRLGFGGYRVDDESEEHRLALEAALEGGINLIDTSTNYTEGGSERLIGGILRLHPKRREELVVVSKAGYLQGSNLEVARAREQLGQPYQELVTYQDGLWHCIHPMFLADQLERCCMRLSLDKLDVLLLHNPEYFLLDAKQKGGTDVNAARAEFDRRMEQAFAFLEELVKEGRIGYYGVSSNTFAAPADEFTATSFARMLELAKKVGGEDHHFAVVQTPLNLLEPEAAESFAAEVDRAGLALLANRPLNCFVQQTLVRLADFESEDEPNLEKSLQAMAEAENEYRETFGPFVQGPGSDQLFRFAENMRGLDMHLQNLDHWTQLESRQIRPALLDQIQALDQAMTGAITEPWVRWREKYMGTFRDVSNDLEEIAIRKSQRVSESVAELMPQLPGAGAGASLSQLAAWVVDGVPGVSSVLVGMRSEDYVDDMLPVLQWSACKNSQQVFEALKEWSNPHGVLA